jgi:hypothetical protein
MPPHKLSHCGQTEAPDQRHTLGADRGRSRGDAPNDVADVVGDQHPAGLVDGDACRASPGQAERPDEAGQHVLRRSGGLAAGEGHEDHLVPALGRAIPGAMLADEGTAPVALRQQGAAIERQPERCRMGAKRIVWNDRLRH